MKYIDNITAQRRAASNLTTQSHSNYGMAKTHLTCCLQSLHSMDLNYDLASQQRKSIANRTMTVSMFKYTNRSKSPGTASKDELHAVLRRD